MPTIRVNDATLYYESHGVGPETIVWAHGLLWDGRMFAPQIAVLQAHYRCITFDFRGQGQSEVTRRGYDMESLAEDAAALIEGLEVAPCHFVGLSMGGFVGMRLAARRPALINSLILLETSADPEPAPNKLRYQLLNLIARWIGLRVVANQVMPVMFGQKFLQDPARAELRAEMRRRMIANDRLGITRSVAGVISRRGVADELAQIQVPTLVMVGDQDRATVPAKAQRIHALIPGSHYVIIPGAGHTATIEEPAAVTTAIEAFLQHFPQTTLVAS